MSLIKKLIGTIITGHNYFNEDYSLSVETKVTGITTDENGYPVIHVQAATYKEASRPIDGTTYPGDVSRSCVHVGRNRWEIRVEDWNTENLDE